MITIDKIFSSKDLEECVLYSSVDSIDNKELRDNISLAIDKIINCYIDTKDIVYSFELIKNIHHHFIVAYDKIYDNYIDLEIKIAKSGDNDLEIRNSVIFEITTQLNSYYIKIYSDIKPFTNEIALDIAKVIDGKI